VESLYGIRGSARFLPSQVNTENVQNIPFDWAFGIWQWLFLHTKFNCSAMSRSPESREWNFLYNKCNCYTVIMALPSGILSTPNVMVTPPWLCFLELSRPTGISSSRE
jgi:hypothetical protein